MAVMTVDLTGIATTAVGGIFSVLGIVLTALISSHVKNTDAAATLNAAVKNSLGAMAQAADMAVATGRPSVTIPGINDNLASGVAYVLAHAGDEAKRLGVTPDMVASKISAQIGLGKIAAAAAPQTVTVQSLGKVS
jgi:hypothetical protein